MRFYFIFVANSRQFAKNIFEKMIIPPQILCFCKNRQKYRKINKSPEIATSAYNVKRGCILRLFYLYIWNIANFWLKYSYDDRHSNSKHHKIAQKKRKREEKHCR
jgi:hypothetical protein